MGFFVKLPFGTPRQTRLTDLAEKTRIHLPEDILLVGCSVGRCLTMNQSSESVLVQSFHDGIYLIC